MGKILTIKGMVYHFKLNNLKEAEECYLHGLEAKKKCRDLLGQAISNGLLGKIYKEMANKLKADSDDTLTMATKQHLNSAIKYLKENHRLSIKIDNTMGLVIAPKSLGECYMVLKDYDTAVEYLEMASQKCADTNDHVQQAECLANIVRCLI